MFSKNVSFACSIAVHNPFWCRSGEIPELSLPVDLMKDQIDIVLFICKQDWGGGQQAELEVEQQQHNFLYNHEEANAGLRLRS